MFEMSENIKDLAAALSKAQARIEKAAKGSDNREYGAKYADLSAIWAACRAALTRNGLSVVQFPGEMIDNRMSMTTMLMHSSGQWIRQPLSIALSKVDAQGYGSATTYARRYALAAVVGVCPEDDDGNAASELHLRQNGTREQRPTGDIDEDQFATLTAIIDEVGANLETFCEYLKVRSLRELPAFQYQGALRALEQKRVQRRKAA